MELCLPLEVFTGWQATCPTVCGTCAFFRTMHGGVSAPSCCVFMLSFLYGPTLTSVHDYWKNHSFNYTGLCWQSNVCFLISQSYSSKEQVPFNSMAAVTICIDFGAQENKIWCCFHIFPIYLPNSVSSSYISLLFCFIVFFLIDKVYWVKGTVASTPLVV